jgi:putative DNA primase/helicase
MSPVPDIGTIEVFEPREPRPPGTASDLANDALIIDPRAPYDTARAFIWRRFTEDGITKIHFEGADCFTWDGTCYLRADDGLIRKTIYEFLAEAKCRDGNGALKDFKPDRESVSKVVDALKAAAHLHLASPAPAWLDDDDHLPAREILACQNGLLHLPTRALVAHSPAFYNHNALDFSFNALAQAPRGWLEFLHQLWPDDPASIETMQEIFGYLLTPDTSQQKAFLVIGPKRSGKGTIARVLARLIGAGNVCAPTLASLAENFGLEPLIDKRVAIVSDARLGGRADQAAIAERLLSVSGEDHQTIGRKFRQAWNGQLAVRFLVLSNEIPRLADTSGALAGRFIVLVLRESFYGREDSGLTARLTGDLPGILNWAIAGWARLAARGFFLAPASSAQAVQQLEDLGSPIGAFLRDRCFVEPGRQVECNDLFEAWVHWCKSQGRDRPGIKQTFGRDLSAAEPGLKITQPRTAKGRERCYDGIGLRPIEAEPFDDTYGLN